MEKKFLFIIVLFLIFFISKCNEEVLEEKDNEDLDDTEYFKKFLKEYLIENKLLDSDRIVKKDEMKKIFIDLITEKDPNNIPSYLSGFFDQLTDYFINTYYKDRNEIRGKEIYDLIDINAISLKMEQIMGENPYYNDSEEEKDYDSRDAVGDPNSGL